MEVGYHERVPTERAFEVQIAPLRVTGDEGHDGSAMLFFRDQTSVRKLERTRVDLIANASHELRTPLASILGFVETLQGPARDDAAARERFLEIMRGQAHRMKRLIEDLLSLSRIELHAHLAPDMPLDLELVVRQMIIQRRRLSASTGLRSRSKPATDPSRSLLIGRDAAGR